MRISSAKKPLSRTTARNSFLVNQFATPGLGSLMAGRWVAGTLQVILAVIGFGFVLAWFFASMSQTYRQLTSDAPASSGSSAWLGETGVIIFAVAWLSALMTSLSLLREARRDDSQAPPPI
jgi:hypothetical protein